MRHVLLLAALGALSPVLLLNAGRVVAAGGPRAGLRFVAGAAACLLPLGVVAMGAVGASATALVQRELVSRGVDTVLALLLLAYGGLQLRQARRPGPGGGAAGPSVRDRTAGRRRTGVLAAGWLGMATNVTTLPLYLSASQRVGVLEVSWGARAVLLLLVTAVVLTPTWLPCATTALTHRRQGMRASTRGRVQRAARAVSIGACLVGGVLILGHAWS